MFHLRFLSCFKSIVLSIFVVTRRAFCCFSRKRKPSYSECEVLTSVNVEQSSYPTNRRSNEVERDWNSWDDSPRTVDEHIEHYRQRLVQPKPVENKEQSMDFFHDMEPKVKKQQKVFINKNTNEDSNFSRLQATNAANIAFKQGAELEDWSDHDEDDAGQMGWDEVTDESAKDLIRQKRREQRALRNQRLLEQKQLQYAQAHTGYPYHA